MSSVFGYIFLNAGGVVTRGINDFDSVGVEGDNKLDVGLEPICFLTVPGLNLGIRLFLSVAGDCDLANGEGALLLSTEGENGCGGGVRQLANVLRVTLGVKLDFDLCIKGLWGRELDDAKLSIEFADFSFWMSLFSGMGLGIFESQGMSGEGGAMTFSTAL